jgi:hypothetical protein
MLFPLGFYRSRARMYGIWYTYVSFISYFFYILFCFIFIFIFLLLVFIRPLSQDSIPFTNLCGPGRV